VISVICYGILHHSVKVYFGLSYRLSAFLPNKTYSLRHQLLVRRFGFKWNFKTSLICVCVSLPNIVSRMKKKWIIPCYLLD